LLALSERLQAGGLHWDLYVGSELARAPPDLHFWSMHTPGRGEGALRRYRISLPETSYFLTLCTENRAEGLTCGNVAPTICAEIASLETDCHWTQRAGVLMPDHLHLFIRLTGKLSIARCVARLKAKTRLALHAQSLSWQTNFYEHRLRPADAVEDVLRYIFLNPYRGGVAKTNGPYRWFWLGTEEEAWFKPVTDRGRPFPEWLR
jgi:REP element-mobilizing transposase RayT